MVLNAHEFVSWSENKQKTQSWNGFLQDAQVTSWQNLATLPHPSTTPSLSRSSLLAESMKIAAITGNLGRLLCLPAALTSCWLAARVVGCGAGWIGGWVGGWWHVWEWPLWLTEMKAWLCLALSGGRRTGENYRSWIFKEKPLGRCFYTG